MVNKKIRNYIFYFLATFITCIFLTSCTVNDTGLKSVKTAGTSLASSETSASVNETQPKPITSESQSSTSIISIPDNKPASSIENSIQESQSTNITSPKEEGASFLTVHFIDVGQGDSELIQTPDGKNILIDGGPKESAAKLVSYLKDLAITKINIVISTHPHEDHIGGLVDVLGSFTVDNVIDSGNPHTTATYKNYLTAIKANNVNYIVPSLGQELDLGQNTKMQILGPVTKTSDLNNSSIVIKLTYNKISFLFAGDAQSQEESQILSLGYNLSSQVLKVGHHGSSSSSSTSFLKAVSPTTAVISCGAGNNYGHPHEITLKNLASLGIAIYRTDITGDIVIQSDGNSLLVIKGSPYTYTDQSSTTKTTETQGSVTETSAQQLFVGSTNSNVFHYPTCSYAKKIKPQNLIYFSSYADAISKGYRPCKVCDPKE